MEHQRGPDIAQKSTSGLAWASSSVIGQGILQLIVLVLLGRLLSPSDFGLVAGAMVVIAFSTIFAQVGLGPAIVQRKELDTGVIGAGFILSILFGLVVGILVYASAPAYGSFIGIVGTTEVLRALSWIFPIVSIGVVPEALILRQLNFRKLALLELACSAIGYGGVGVVSALAGHGVWALVSATLTQAALKSTLLLFLGRSGFSLSFSLLSAKDLLNYGGGFTLARIFNYLALQGDNFVVGRLMGAASLGLYGRAYQLLMMPTLAVGQVLDRVLFPIMAALRASPQTLAITYRRSLAAAAMIALPATSLFVILGPQMVSVLLGPQWEGAIAPFQVLAVSLLMRTSYKMSDALARATGAVYRRAWRQGVYAVAVILGSAIGAFWGLPGVAAGVVVAISLNFLMMLELSTKLVPIRFNDILKSHLPGLATMGLVAAIVFPLTQLLAPHQPPIVVLAIGIAIGTGATAGGWYFSPSIFLGEDGRWVLTHVHSFLKRKPQVLSESASEDPA